MWITPPIIVFSINYSYSANNSGILEIFESYYRKNGWEIVEINIIEKLNKKFFQSTKEFSIIKKGKDGYSYDDISEIKIKKMAKMILIID